MFVHLCLRMLLSINICMLLDSRVFMYMSICIAVVWSRMFLGYYFFMMVLLRFFLCVCVCQ